MFFDENECFDCSVRNKSWVDIFKCLHQAFLSERIVLVPMQLYPSIIRRGGCQKTQNSHYLFFNRANLLFVL